jgi:malate dehydrogenase
MKSKVAVIGAGNVGASAALFVAERALGDVVLIDRPEMEGMPQGKALDMQQASPIWHKGAVIEGATDLAAVKGADVVIMTAGFPRKPGMSRSDLLKANADIIRPAAEAVKQHAPNATVIVVTNPLDVMAWMFWKVSGLPKNRVVGMAGILDSARFQLFLADAAGVSVKDVRAMVLGGHGDTMVPIISNCTINGIPVKQLVPADKLAAIVERTRNGGGEIVKLMGTSAFLAPATAAIQMATAYLKDQKRLLACAAYLDGQYGFKDLYLGVPIVIGAGGVEKIVAIELSADEKAMLDKSAAAVREVIEAGKKL